jgi:hypothetical protein
MDGTGGSEVTFSLKAIDCQIVALLPEDGRISAADMNIASATRPSKPCAPAFEQRRGRETLGEKGGGGL